MACRKCNNTGLHHALPCVHCTLKKEASQLRKAMYPAKEYRVASAAYHAGGAAKPLARLVLAQSAQLNALNPAKRAVLAQDARRCIQNIRSYGGTPQGRVFRDLHKIVFDAAEAARPGTAWKPDISQGSVYVLEIRDCRANESWLYDDIMAERRAAERAARETTATLSAGLPVTAQARNRSILLSVSAPGSLWVAVVFDVVVDAQMVTGAEFRLSDDCYHLPPGVQGLVSPMKVGSHGPCASCDLIVASAPLQGFKAAFAQASVKVEESKTFAMLRQLKELHQQMTGDPGTLSR